MTIGGKAGAHNKWRISEVVVPLAAAGLIFAGTGAEARSTARQDGDFPLIRYRLPVTAVSASLALTLESCTNGPQVSGEFGLQATARAAPPSFVVTPAGLESARIKREIDIGLHESGTISSIRSKATDRTGAILGNIVKFAASVAGAILGMPVGAVSGSSSHPRIPLSCSPAIKDIFTRIANIDATIARMRQTALPIDPHQYGANARMIDRLIAERETLRSSLRLELETPLDLTTATVNAERTQASGTSEFDAGAIAEAWLEGPQPDAIGVNWTASLASGQIPLTAAEPANECASETSARPGFICFVTPAEVRFQASVQPSGGLAFVGALTDARPFPVPQWGKLERLYLGAKIGSAREASLTLDKFGRVTEMKWSSEARAENLTGSAATLAEQVQGALVANNEVARQKSEIEELTTQQTLNRLRACRKILNAGGSKCPAEADEKKDEDEGQQ